MCLFAVVLSIVLSHFYEKTQSIWVPSIMHGAFNAAADVPLLLLLQGTTHYLLGPVPCGLILLIPLAVIAAIFLLKKK